METNGSKGAKFVQERRSEAGNSIVCTVNYLDTARTRRCAIRACLRVCVGMYKHRLDTVSIVGRYTTEGKVAYFSSFSIHPVPHDFVLFVCVYVCFCTLPSIKTIQLGRPLTPRQPFNDIYWNFFK